ncbi:WAT1-related protein At5g07050-like, partial [Cucurbita pepo subsp. pepo]|uniref:WAT1-related protein At5g07050-like n=1 Tax=Cucurbita pepo subsp. pepo TaxID=3664 RepID=UPI000C9D3193
MEKLDLKNVRRQAKVLGTIVTVVGAMLMTFYKGSVINFFWTGHGRHPTTPPTADAAAASNLHNDGKFIKGSILLIIATLAWAAFFILQAITLRKYTAHLSLTTMVCFLGTLQAIVVTLAMDHPRHSWSIGWDMNLLAAAYG